MYKKISVTCILILVVACNEKPPTQLDSATEVSVLALWNDSHNPEIVNYVPLANAEMVFVSEYGTKSYFADENGILKLNNILPSSVYQISARKAYNTEASNIIAGDIENIEIKSGISVIDTIYAKPISVSGISINEIYSAGVENQVYPYDQFIELYNASSEIKFLDGMQVYRLSGTDNNTKYPGVDWDNDDDIDGISYAFKFPGKPGEKNHPMAPKTFISLAQMAYNHSIDYSNSPDLSNSDWEFFNQLDPYEYDNPNVPNLENIRLDKNEDFWVRTYNEIVVITNGYDSIWEDGIDIETILDGVEYQLSFSSAPVTLDNRVDRGCVKCPSPQSGKSMQRREPGLDTNNGTLDWEILPKPTPGYQ